MRYLTLTLICGALIVFRSHSAESLAAPSSHALPDAPPGDIAKRPPPDPALAIIERLQQPGLTPEQTVGLIESLGGHRTSATAARGLLLWIDYYPPGAADRARPSSTSLLGRSIARPSGR